MILNVEKLRQMDMFRFHPDCSKLQHDKHDFGLCLPKILPRKS